MVVIESGNMSEDQAVQLVVTPLQAHRIMVCIKLCKELFPLPPYTNVNTSDFGSVMRDLMAADINELESTLAEQLRKQKPEERD